MNDGPLDVAAVWNRWRASIGLLLVACMIFLPGLSATRLWDEDEGFYASTAFEMFVRTDWMVPYFNGQLFGHKPPWMYWMMMLGFQVVGVSELGARLPSALFSIGSVFLTMRIGSLMFQRPVGWLAGFVLATSLFFTVSGRSATADPFLVFFSTAAMLLFIQLHWSRSVNDLLLDKWKESKKVDGKEKKWKGRRYAIGIYALLGLGTLVKGPIAVLFPLTVIGSFTFFHELATHCSHVPTQRDGWIRYGLLARLVLSLKRAIAQLHLFTGIPVLLLVAAPWYSVVGWQTNGEFLREFFGVHHLQRATSSMEGHQGSMLFYYPVSILIGMFPWTVFTVPGMIVWWQGYQRPENEQRSLVFLTGWILVYAIVFSAAATKLPNYILPIYPAIAILFAYLIDRWLQDAHRYHPFWHRASFVTLIVSGLAMMVLVPLLQWVSWEGETAMDRIGMANSLQTEIFWLGGLGIPIVIGGIISWSLIECQRYQAALASFIVMATVFLVLFWNAAAPWADQFQTAKKLVTKLRSINTTSSDHDVSTDSRGLATYYYFRPSMVFYHQASIRRCWDHADVEAFWRSHPNGAMIVEASRFAEIETVTLKPLRVILRVPRFPEKGELILVEQSK